MSSIVFISKMDVYLLCHHIFKSGKNFSHFKRWGRKGYLCPPASRKSQHHILFINTPMRSGVQLFLFDMWENWGWERCINSSKNRSDPNFQSLSFCPIQHCSITTSHKAIWLSKISSFSSGKCLLPPTKYHEMRNTPNEKKKIKTWELKTIYQIVWRAKLHYYSGETN